VHCRLIWRIDEVRFGDRPLTKEHPDGQDTRIRADTRALEGVDGRPGEESDLRSDLVRLAARLIIEEGLEGEATDALGREYYGRGAAPGVGYRNGHPTGRLKTAEGVVADL
jgi:hypothetical protein